MIIFKNIGTKHPACPVKSDKYRIEDYYSYMVIKPYSEVDKPGIEFGLTYYDNPGISIPDAITTWVAMKAMPEFLKRLREAAKEYRKYLRETRRDVTNRKDKTNDVLETSFQRNHSLPVIRSRKEDSVDVMVSPATVGESENNSYWKYLRPTYYFS